MIGGALGQSLIVAEVVAQDQRGRSWNSASNVAASAHGSNAERKPTAPSPLSLHVDTRKLSRWSEVAPGGAGTTQLGKNGEGHEAPELLSSPSSPANAAFSNGANGLVAAADLNDGGDLLQQIELPKLDRSAWHEIQRGRERDKKFDSLDAELAEELEGGRSFNLVLDLRAFPQSSVGLPDGKSRPRSSPSKKCGSSEGGRRQAQIAAGSSSKSASKRARSLDRK